MGTQDSQELTRRAVREIEASSRTSPIPPGPTEAADRATPQLVEAINQVFALFRLNYHNQFYAAYSDAEQLRQIKKLWLESLRPYPPAMILQGARQALESSDYLPTLNRMRRCCDDSLPALGLPGARDAYLEASSAPEPPESHSWSHPVVYWAGRDCGWRFLATAGERESWPRFEAAYRERCAAALRGIPLAPVPEPEIPALTEKPLDGGAALKALRRLREEHDV